MITPEKYSENLREKYSSMSRDVFLAYLKELGFEVADLREEKRKVLPAKNI